MKASVSEAIPRGWDVDHETPTDFVVRCTECGRVSIRDERASAHRQAGSHAFRCSQTGVTPVSRPGDEISNEEIDNSGSSLVLEGVNPATENIVGMEIVVRYESISSRAGTQRTTGLVDSMLGDDSAPYRGIEVLADDDRRLRIDVVDEIVLCPSRTMDTGTMQWRTIGEAEILRPARIGDSTSDSAVATDGGVQ